MIVRMARVEHILLESDERDVPTLETARRIHARIALAGGSWRPSLELALIDYFYLSVRTTRARAARATSSTCASSIPHRLARRLPWSWIAAGAVFLALAILGAREIAASAAPWWRHEWLPATVAFFAVAGGALSRAVLRTTETLTLFSAHGRAKLVCHEEARERCARSARSCRGSRRTCASPVPAAGTARSTCGTRCASISG